jgi:hypothetical protein
MKIMKNMTIRPIAALALLAVLGVGTPAIAGAASNATTAKTTVVAYQAQLKAWHTAVDAYNAARAKIQRTYNASVRSATAALNVALKGTGSHTAALATFHAAIKAAKTVKLAAMTTLGAAPVRPTK